MWVEIIFSIIAALGFVSNILILYSIVKYRTLRKKTYFLLVSLAFCDLLKAVVLVNLVIYKSLRTSFASCIGTSTLGLTLVCITTTHLAAESVNRLILLIAPFKYAKMVTKKVIALVLFLIWFFPIFYVLAMPPIWLEGDWLGHTHFQTHMFGCSKNKTMEKITEYAGQEEPYVIILHFSFFAIPLLIMVFSYSIVLQKSYKFAKVIRGNEVQKMNELKPTVDESPYSNPMIQMVTGCYDIAVISKPLSIPEKVEHKQRASSIIKATKEIKKLLRDRQREIRASKTIIIIVLAFVCCNAPIFFITWHDLKKVQVTDLNVRQALAGLAFSQVFIDPMVYFLRLKDYKDIRRKCKRIGGSIARKTRQTIRRL